MNKIYQKVFPGSPTAGFTLIELLVVVLIIGILAAVAVPQYETAVDKARFSTLMALTKAVKTDQELFYLANGFYSADLNELAGSLPDGWRISDDGQSASDGRQLINISNGAYVYMRNKDGTPPANSFLMYYDQANPGVIHCYAYRGDGVRGERLCRALGGEKTAAFGDCSGGCTIYRLP